jgi:hypothetical protein
MMESARAFYYLVLDFFWGDVWWVYGFLRAALKIAFAFALAFLIHEYVLAWFLTVSPGEVKELARTFNQVSSDVRGIGERQAAHGGGLSESSVLP